MSRNTGLFGQCHPRFCCLLALSHFHMSSHPNIIQMWGTVSAAGIHAVFFHGGAPFRSASSLILILQIDLILLRHLLELNRHSLFSTVAIYAQAVSLFAPCYLPILMVSRARSTV